jgi:hypothetical protein
MSIYIKNLMLQYNFFISFQETMIEELSDKISMKVDPFNDYMWVCCLPKGSRVGS